MEDQDLHTQKNQKNRLKENLSIGTFGLVADIVELTIRPSNGCCFLFGKKIIVPLPMK